MSCVLDKRHAVEVAMQLLNHLPTGSVALLRAALLVPVRSWQAVLLGLEGMIHDAASRTLAIRSTVMLDELHQPYVTAAQAKSLSELLVVLRYRLRLAISPIISGVDRSLA